MRAAFLTHNLCDVKCDIIEKSNEDIVDTANAGLGHPECNDEVQGSAG